MSPSCGSGSRSHGRFSPDLSGRLRLVRRIHDGLFDRVKTIGEYRDAVLVLISVDYLLGYFSWSYHAAQNDLGLVPALDAQYLVAGVLPTIILAVGIGLVIAHVRFSRWTSKDPSPHRYRWGTALGFLGLSLAIVGVVAGFVYKSAVDAWSVSVAAGGAYVMMLGAILQGPKGDKIFRYYGLSVLWIVVAATPLVLFLFYFEKVLAEVPAALGGPEPRCVRIDYVADQLTPGTRVNLASKETVASAVLPVAPVIQTGPVDLLFSGPEFTMVRARGKVYSLSKEAIRALSPCT
jgi:hypothetical protein